MASGIRCSLPVPVAVAVAPAAARRVLATALVHIRQQRQLARALDGAGDLALMAPAGAGDPPRADLALLGDELLKRADVLVVDLLDLVATVLAWLAPAASGWALFTVYAANRLAATARFCHWLLPFALPCLLERNVVVAPSGGDRCGLE